MQTRSMTRRGGLSRSNSLDRRSPSPARAPITPMDVTIADAPVEVVSSELALIDHPGDAPVQDQQQLLAQNNMINMMQAQAMVQVASQRDQEARLHQAFVETEARLHLTAQALVQAHAKEQEIETSRSMQQAIQTALVDAHTHAHEQAMQAAHNRLVDFTTEINAKIQAQLTDAVNDVGTKGVAYIEDVTSKHLSALQDESRAEMEKIARHVLAAFQPTVEHEVTKQLVEESSTLQRQVKELQVALPKQIADAEGRCFDSIAARAGAQAERHVAQVESRLMSEITARLDQVENRAQTAVTDSIKRAEAHCNVVERRVSENVERALSALRLSQSDRPQVGGDQNELDAMMIQKLESNMSTVVSQMKHMVERLAIEAISAQAKCLVEAECTMIVQRHESQLNARLQDVIAAAMKSQVEVYVSSLLQSRTRELVSNAIPQFTDDYLSQKLSGCVQALIASSASELVNPCIDSTVQRRIRSAVEAAVPQLVSGYLDDQLNVRTREIVGGMLPQLVKDQVGEALGGVRAAAAETAPLFSKNPLMLSSNRVCVISSTPSSLN
jgi:hypothetical protein